MKSILKNFCWFLTVICASACTTETNWNGTYVYEADYGANHAETPMLVTYTLTVDNDSCALEEIGYQTATVIICKTAVSNNTLNIMFKSYEDGSTKNKYGNNIYAINDTLFTFTLSSGKVITTWNKHLPESDAGKTGTMFVKMD